MSSTRLGRAWSRLAAATGILVALLLMITAAPAYAADTTPPDIRVPSDIRVVSGGGLIRVPYSASARDDVDGNVPVTCTPANGARFELGTTEVFCTAQDKAGNVGTDSLRVTVINLTLALNLRADQAARTAVVGEAFPTVSATVTRSDGLSTSGRQVEFIVSGASFAGGSGLARVTVGPDSVATAPAFTAGTLAGNFSLTVRGGNDALGRIPDDTVPLYVLAGPTSRLRVTGPTTLAPSVDGEFSVVPTDQYDNESTPVPDGSPSLSITPDASCSGSTCRLSTLGAHTVRASWGGFTGQTEVTGVPGPLAFLDISPGIARIQAGQTQAFQVTGYDADRYRIGDLTSSARFTIVPNGSCTANVCTATTAGPHTVTATVSTPSGDVETRTGLAVDPASASSIRVTGSTGTIEAGGSATYTVRAYDAYGNAGDDLTNDPSTTLTIGPDGSCTGATCTATTAGPHTVTASYDDSLRDTTALNVVPAAASEIRLTPSRNSFSAGDSVALTARAYDRFGNAGGDVTGSTTFTVSPDGSCTGASCTATVAGPHTVTGRFGSLQTSTPVAVVPAAAASIRLTASTTSIIANASADITSRAYDRYGNAGDTVTGSTTFTISPDGSCTGASCAATVAGAHTVTGKFGSLQATAPLAVRPAAAAQVEVRDGNSQQVTTNSAFPTNLSVKVSDLYGNVVPAATVTFTVTGGPAAFGGSATASAVTGSDGVATAPRLTAGSSTGSVTITAATGSATAATFLESVITPAAARADLAVTLTGPTSYPRNGSSTLTLKITNKGPNPATTVSTLLSVGCGLSVTNGGGGTVRGSSVLFSTGTLASGASQTWPVTVKTAANPPRTVSAGAATLSAVRDPSYTNNVTSVSGRTS